jgi:hypothetical protein
MNIEHPISNAEYREQRSGHVHLRALLKSQLETEKIRLSLWQRERIKVRDWTSTAPAAQTRSPARRCQVPGEPDDSKIAVQRSLCGPQECRARSIANLSDTIVMPATVQFDRALRGRTVEIQDVAVQRMLTAKFVACKVSVPQMPPKYALRIGCFLSQQTPASISTSAMSGIEHLIALSALSRMDNRILGRCPKLKAYTAPSALNVSV